MARARLIKPGFFTNEELHTLHPYARLLYVGLWTLADREGRLKDRPLRIKAELFPYDTVKTEPLIGKLTDLGFLCRYQAAGDSFIHIITFKEHQHPHPKEPLSLLPPCPVHEPCMNHASAKPEPVMRHVPPAKTSEAEAGSSIPSIPSGSSEAEADAAPAASLLRDRMLALDSKLPAKHQGDPETREEFMQLVEDYSDDQIQKAVRGCLSKNLGRWPRALRAELLTLYPPDENHFAQSKAKLDAAREEWKQRQEVTP